MSRPQIALPTQTPSATWNPSSGRFLVHPAGLVEGLRPEWDEVRARREALVAARRPQIVQLQEPRARRRVRAALRRIFAAVLGGRA